MNPKHHDTIIIGAGASGLMVANRYKDRDIAIIEANSKPARKIEISGGKRCNITNKNLSPNNYLGDKNFIKTILKEFDELSLLNFLKKRGLTPVLQKRDQYFCPKSSQEIIDLLLREIKTPIYYNHQVIKVKKIKDHFIIDDRFSSKRLIIATGGLSFPKIGASDIAFKIAKDFGHSIKTPSAALVGFTLQREQFWMKELSGISLEVKIEIGDKKFIDSLLCTHKGISGPVILNASLYWQKGNITIDFIPHISLDEQFFQQNKTISNSLFIPKRFAKALLRSITLDDKSLKNLSLKERDLLKNIKSYTFAPAGNFGYSKAEVTRGGISTNEIDPNTMMSKKCENLYFLGECLDVTGELGGYNLQWAFSTAFALKL